MKIFKDLPTDIVNHILSYDNRFIIRNGSIMNKLNMIKYKTIIHLLEHKPKIMHYPYIMSPYVMLPQYLLFLSDYKLVKIDRFMLSTYNY